MVQSNVMSNVIQQLRAMGLSEADYQSIIQQIGLAGAPAGTINNPEAMSALYKAAQQRQDELQRAEDEKRRQGSLGVWKGKPPTCSSCPLYVPTTSWNGHCASHPEKMYNASAKRHGCRLHPAVEAVMDVRKTTELEDFVTRKITE